MKIYNILIEAKDKRTRLSAISALSNFSSKKIRDLVIAKIKALKNPCEYLCLLTNNYKKGDHVLLIDLLNRSNDYDYIHSLASEIITIYSKIKTKECKLPLEIIYQKMNCGMHRHDVVEILHENNLLSKQILSEIEYDSYFETRSLYRKICKLKTRHGIN